MLQGTLRSIELAVTSKCNMQCAHCYAEPFSKDIGVSLEKLEPFFKEAYDLGVSQYILQGGEAILDMPRLENIIRMISPEETFINVASNGWAMTRDVVRHLKYLNVDKITFSLDSGFEEEHDANRRKGSFKKVLEAIDVTIDEGLLAAVSFVVTHQNLHTEAFAKVVDYALQKKIRVDVQIAMPVGKWEGEKDLLITPEDAAHILRMRQELPTTPNGQKSISRDTYKFSNEIHCPAGTEFMAVSVSGDVFPCNFCQYSLGKIGDIPLAEMRKAITSTRWFNGQHPCCPMGEDQEFFDLYVAPNVKEQKPLDAYNLFNLVRV